MLLKLFFLSTAQKKLERAQEMRERKLRKVVQKAQGEETKVNEIAFINELQVFRGLFLI